jgi:hypothetical protein
MIGFFNYLALPAALALAIGCYTALKPDRQALHDRLTNTAVYNAAPQPLPLEAEPPETIKLPRAQALREAA